MNANDNPNKFGPYTVERWGTGWVLTKDRADGVRPVVTLPFKTRKEAREWAAHYAAMTPLPKASPR